jgi:hypothetical protein
MAWLESGESYLTMNLGERSKLFNSPSRRALALPRMPHGTRSRRGRKSAQFVGIIAPARSHGDVSINSFALLVPVALFAEASARVSTHSLKMPPGTTLKQTARY